MGGGVGIAKHSIYAAFATQDTVEDIVQQSLDKLNNDFSKETLKTLEVMSPTSLEVTLEGLKRGAYQGPIGQDSQMEDRMSQAFMREGSDFYRGAHALFVDNSRAPQWSPAGLEGVTDEMVESFAPLGKDEWQIPS